MVGIRDMGGNPSCELCFPSCMGMQYLFLVYLSLLSIHQQSRLQLVSHFFQGDIFLGNHWPSVSGVCSTRQPTTSPPSQPHLLLQVTLGNLVEWHYGNIVTCFCAMPATLIAYDCAY